MTGGFEPPCVQLPFHLLRRQRGYVKMKCANSTCDKEAKVKFCSRSCSVTVTNVTHKKRQRTSQRWKKCPYCGKDCTSSWHVQCRSEYEGNRTLENVLNSLSIQGRHPSWKFVHLRHHNQKVNKELRKHPCQMCGYKLVVELSHIRPVRSFPLTATLSEVNDPSNILVLCPNHHWEFDHELLRLEDIPPRKTV